MAHLTSDSGAIDTGEKIWDLTQAINVKGVWFGCKHAILAMREVSGRNAPLFLSWTRQNKADPSLGLGTGGSIINVASLVAVVGAATPQLACKHVYPSRFLRGWNATDTTSKGAVLALTRELAMVHAREGIRFNALCP
jgi:NAD(P)-dependent dehydrogenase (short-subunit alcohol dehydrogenase family)